MKIKKTLLITITLSLFMGLNIFMFTNKPLNSEISHFTEDDLGLYLESISAKDLIIMLAKDDVYYTFGHYTIPNFSYTKYKKVIKIKKTEIKIIRSEDIKINDAFYNSSCNILIVFSKYKPKYSYLNYKNKGIKEDDIVKCFNTFPVFENINK